MMGITFIFDSSIKTGCSSRHDTHHDAHTLSSHTLPRISCGEMTRSAACNCGTLNAGAALLINGDGTSRGLSVSPTPSSSASNRKRPSGIAWLKQFGDPYLLSAFDSTGRVGIDYGVYGVPETFLIDKQGVIRYKHIGIVTPEIVRDKLLPLAEKLNRG